MGRGGQQNEHSCFNKDDFVKYYNPVKGVRGSFWRQQRNQPQSVRFLEAFLQPPPLSFPFQEYNMYGWWVGELNSLIGIVPKDYLTAAFETEE